MNGEKHNTPSAIRRFYNSLFSRPLLFSIFVFFIISGIAGLVIYQRADQVQREQDRKALLVLETAQKRLQQSLNEGFSATLALSFIISREGLTADFDSVAAGLMQYNQHIDALQLVPGGVIRYVYPEKGNESVLHYNILGDPARNKEAYKAIERRQLYFAGPFALRQGGVGVVGRLPVFIDNRFWGFSAVVIRLETLLKAAGIDTTSKSGYFFQLSKIHPDSGEEEFFLPPHPGKASRSTSIMVPDGEWKLSVTPAEKTTVAGTVIPLSLIALLFSLLAAWLAWIILKRPAELEKIVAEKTEALEAYSKRNHALVTAFPDTIFVMDARGNFIDYNNPFDNPLLVKPDEFIGKNVTDVLPPNLAAQVMVNIDKIFHEKKPFVHAYRLDDERGPGFFEATYSRVSETEVMSVVRNVTAAVTAEQTARKNEEKLRQVLTSSADDFYVIDRQYTVTLINAIAEKNLEKAWGKKVVTGMPILDAVPDGKKKALKQYYDRAFSGEQFEYEVHHHLSEDMAWVLVSYTPVRDEQGSITGVYVVTKNITARKKVEEEIIRSNTRFEMISRTTNDAVWEWDLDTGRLWSNVTHQQLYGLTLEDPVPSEEEWASRIHPEDRDEVVKTQQNILASDKNVFISEYRFYTESDGYRDIYDRCYIVRDSKGKPVRMMGSMMDITDRKRAEKAIRDSEETQRLIMNSALDAIVCTNLQGAITVWTPQAEKIFGWTESAITGKLLTDTIIPERYREAHRKGMERYVKTGEKRILNRLLEMSALRASGEEFPVELSITPVVQGSNRFFCAFIRDITARKKAESELKEREEIYRALVENAPEALVVFDADKGNFVNVSESAVRLFGIPAEKLLELGPLQLSPAVQPDGRNSAESAMEKIEAALGGAKSFFEWTHLDAGGNELTCEIWLVRLPSENKRLVRGSIIDIRERKKAEKKLQESEERYRTLVEQATDCIVMADPEGRFVEINNAAARLFGYSKTEFRQISIPDIILLGENEPPLRFEELRQGRNVLSHRKARRKDGSVFDLEINSKMLPNGYFLGIARDISDRIAAQKALQESETRYRTFFENSLDGILLTSPDGSILSANEAACTMFQLTEKEMIRAGRQGIIDHDDPRLHELLDIRQKMGKAMGELTGIKKDGTTFPVEISSALFTDSAGNIRTTMIIRDVTERKKAQEEILKTNTRFHLVSRATSDIIWDWDLLTDDLWWNDNYYATLGYKKVSELVHADEWISRIHPDDIKNVKAKIYKAIRGKTTAWRDEYRFAHKDGRYLHFLDRGFIMRDKEGKALRMIGAMTDMTPVYQAQREVAESENRLRTILDTDPECIKLMERGCILADINKAGLAMIEAENIEQVRGKSILPVVAEAYREEAAALVERAFRGEPGTMEFEMVTLRGRERWCQISVVPFRNADGEILMALGVTIDITGMKNATLELQRNEEKYRTLVEQAVDAIALYDAAGIILDVNTGASNLLGYSKEELAGMRLTDILLDEEVEENPIRYDVLRSGESTIKQRRMRRKNGSVVVTEVRSQQLPDGRFLSVVRDLTERIRTEEELQASYKAVRKLTAHLQEIREAERAHIAREIHDELGQQLTVLKMDVSWLNKKINSGDPAVQAKMKELLGMLDNTVKTVRRISSELRPSLLDDLGLVAAMEWQLREFEKRSGISTILLAPETEIGLSDSVKTTLFRIFQESLTNVARHAQAKNITVRLSRENDNVILSIMDDGRGFDKKEVAQKRTLGILGMMERTTMIGGQYDITTAPDAGTVVSVSIPLHEDDY